jgi:hypothetical protein
MNILTNRLKINFNIDAIKEDFVFIRLERKSKDQKDKWYGRKELDHLFGKDFNAVSILFQYGSFAFAMFKKPVDVYQVINHIRRNEQFQNNIVVEVVPLAVLDVKKDCICEAWLAQIQHNGKKIYLGLYESIDDAIAARIAAEKKYFTHAPDRDNEVVTEKPSGVLSFI